VSSVVGFRRWWRLTVTWQSGTYSPTRHPEQVIEVHTVAQLRATVLAARADPRIETYGYRLIREWVDDGQTLRCRRGHELPPARVSVDDCCCPDGGHRRTRCTCGDELFVPERGPGCRPVPADPEAGVHYWQTVNAGASWRWNTWIPRSRRW
jgi:hypothetical protein